jgi:hypothetical protein
MHEGQAVLVLLASAAVGGAWGRLAEGLARAGLAGLLSVPLLRLLALVVRFWREDEQALAGLAALLLVLLGVVVVRHLVA